MTKIEVTALQRANALEALNVMWPNIPEERVVDRLLAWREPSDDANEETIDAANDYAIPPPCGTTACFGGWCEWYQPFRKQLGLAPDKGEMDIESLHDLFGAGKWHLTSSTNHNMFAIRGGHPADDGFEGSDHELVSNRLRWLLENSEMEKVQRSELTVPRMPVANEKVYSKVIDRDQVIEWTGIGWIATGAPSDDDRMRYPEVESA